MVCTLEGRSDSVGNHFVGVGIDIAVDLAVVTGGVSGIAGAAVALQEPGLSHSVIKVGSVDVKCVDVRSSHTLVIKAMCSSGVVDGLEESPGLISIGIRGKLGSEGEDVGKVVREAKGPGGYVEEYHQNCSGECVEEYHQNCSFLCP